MEALTDVLGERERMCWKSHFTPLWNVRDLGLANYFKNSCKITPSILKVSIS